jgi:phage terminase small subunit
MNKPAKITAENSKEPQENNHESIKKTPIDPKDFALKPRQKLFIAEYLVDLDPKRAAIAVGYSEKAAYSIGRENLQKPHIKAAIAEEIEKRKDRIGITAEEVINELRLIGMANMSDFVKVNEDGSVQVIPLDQLTEGKSRIIKKIREKRVIKSTAEGDQILDGTYEFELCDKVKSLELLSRHLGILHDKQEIDLKQPLQLTVKKFCSRKKESGGSNQLPKV